MRDTARKAFNARTLKPSGLQGKPVGTLCFNRQRFCKERELGVEFVLAVGAC